MWTVYHLKADETGIVEYNTPDTCLTKEEFTWRTMDEELFLIYEGGATDSFFYSFDNSRLHLYDSENRLIGMEAQDYTEFGTNILSADLTGYTGAHKVKIMMWDSLNGMVPLTEFLPMEL